MKEQTKIGLHPDVHFPFCVSLLFGGSFGPDGNQPGQHCHVYHQATAVVPTILLPRQPRKGKP